MPGCKTSVIKRDETAKKRKCAVVFMSKIDAELVEEIKKGVMLEVCYCTIKSRVLLLYYSY